MKINSVNGLLLASFTCATAILGSRSLSAAVIDLRDAARAEPSLIHHYTFEGTQTDSKNLRLLDHAGTADLKEYKNVTPSNIVYETGYDALSMGGSGVHATNSFGTGAGWDCTNAIALPATLTVELLVCPRGVPSYDSTFVVSTRNDERRGYFLIQKQDLKFNLKVGAKAEITILEPYLTNHWYYVVSTYAVSGSKTTVNCYYVDLTAGGELQHPIVNSVVDDTYGTSGNLGVGCMVYGNPSYFPPATIDEVAFYGTVFSAEKVGAHLAELRRELPVVEYREIFPCDTIAQHNTTVDGWNAHYGTNATYTFSSTTAKSATAFDEDLPAVASLPPDTGAISGYLFNHSGPTNENYLYWSDEMTNQLDVSWLNMVTFDTRCAASRTLRLALRVDTNDTPAMVEDDLWFVGADFDNAPGTSALAIPSSDALWRRHWFEINSGEWAALSFTPESTLVRGETKTSLPTNGLVTAFGVLQDYHEPTKNLRLDNFTIYARRVYPPQGTLILIQ